MEPRWKAFPDGDELWHVDWLSHLERQPTNREPRVWLLISPVRDEALLASGEPIKGPDDLVDWSRQRPWCVGISSLPVLPIGTLLRGARLAPENRLRRYVTQEFGGLSLAPDGLDVVNAGNRDAVGQYLVPPFTVRLLNNDWPTAMSSLCLTIRRGNDPHALMVPTLEVLRYYYGRSSYCLRTIVNHGFDDVGQARLLNLDECSRDPDGTYFLMLNKNTHAGDVPIIALLYTSPHARSCAERIRSTLMRQHSNRALQPVAPDARPPFDGVGTLQVMGCRVRSKDREPERFLVFRILRGSLFADRSLRLAWERDNRNPENLDPEADRDESWLARAAAATANAEINFEFEPNRPLAGKLKSNEAEFLDLPQIRRASPAEPRFKRVLQGTLVSPTSVLAAGDMTHALGERVGGVGVAPKDRSPGQDRGQEVAAGEVAAAGFRFLVNVVEGLRNLRFAQHRRLEARFITIPTWGVSGPASFLPARAAGLDRGYKQPVAIAEVRDGDVCGCLFELLPRKRRADRFSLLLIWRGDLAPPLEWQVAETMRIRAEGGRWFESRSLEDVGHHRFLHLDASPEGMVGRLAKWLDGLKEPVSGENSVRTTDVA